MHPPKREHPKEKTRLHPRSKHRERYDFKRLIEGCPELARFVAPNLYNDESIDFFDPKAVVMLNRALLKHYYHVEHWSIPQDYLCPPIPGRADYIHYMADILSAKNDGKIPTGSRVRCLDVGVGASCVYPIIGNREYGWSWIGTDIDPVSLACAASIIAKNRPLEKAIELRLQENPRNTFQGIIQPGEQIDLSICNPPFHASLDEARSGTIRKLKHLQQKKTAKPVLNFGGQNSELWCEGGEARFVCDMIVQSKQFSASCFFFSSIVSKQSNLQAVYRALKKAAAAEVQTIPVGQGNKSGRIVAWTFFSRDEQRQWVKSRWNKLP